MAGGETVIVRRIRVLINIFASLIKAFLNALPNDGVFCRLRGRYHRILGFDIHPRAILFRNVSLLGKIKMGEGSSISDNCCLNGASVGITIGKEVMIAPGCVIVAFNHAYSDINLPMSKQGWVEKPIFIEDDVWIGANCTITCGVTIGRGSIVGAGAVVTRDVPSNTIVGGIPAVKIGMRQIPNGD